MAQEEIIFPNNIRNIRLANGMKMTELARRAGLSLSAVSKIEKGVRRLNQKQLLNIWNRQIMTPEGWQWNETAILYQKQSIARRFYQKMILWRLSALWEVAE